MTCQAAQASGNAPLSGASEKTNEEISIDTVRENMQSILDVLMSGETTFVEAEKKITSSTPEELDALLYSSSNPGGNPSQNPAGHNTFASRKKRGGSSKEKEMLLSAAKSDLYSGNDAGAERGLKFGSMAVPPQGPTSSAAGNGGASKGPKKERKVVTSNASEITMGGHNTFASRKKKGESN